ncbi:MAG: 4-hydroxy-3-methylbut-2-enyl diphosphate reductase [Planctomycetes bacterium]|nr:4-hydroxy-3-methylbut-2-enyl diphosphate reductase [Planctomycetota bacterium]
MQILRADAMGMCFGVRDALAATEQVEQPDQVTMHGELVHNGEVLARLDARGFRRSPERARAVPATPAVLITAHGVSDRERARLAAAGKQILDTTCPLVRRAHEAAQLLEREGRRVVVIGRAEHVEVRGIVEDLQRPVVVAGPEQVQRWPEARLGVVCQTTTPDERVAATFAAIRAANPHADVRLIDTVCNPTKARGRALEELLPRVDALVVVGGRDSNNTRKLAERGRARGVPTCHVESERELVPGWFEGRRAVGLTAGTSTLPETIERVHRWLCLLAATAPVRAS